MRKTRDVKQKVQRGKLPKPAKRHTVPSVRDDVRLPRDEQPQKGDGTERAPSPATQAQDQRTWLDIDPAKFPKKHAPGALKRGDSVWYKGDRYWVEYAPSSWDKGTHVRISDKPVNPDPAIRSGSDLCYVDDKGHGHGNVISFCVYADVLELAPVRANAYARQPTQADVARQERHARGERDIGDSVAVLLREAKSLDDVYRIGAKFLGVREEELRAKYVKLNPGQQRMNIGNRMRHHAKKQS